MGIIGNALVQFIGAHYIILQNLTCSQGRKAVVIEMDEETIPYLWEVHYVLNFEEFNGKQEF